MGFQFGVSFTHVCNQLRHKLIKEGGTSVEERIAVANSAAQDSADHITRFLVARQLTVRDSKSNRTDMVGYDAHSDVGLLVLAVAATAYFAYLLQHRLEHIGVVIGGLALYRTHQTFEAHTGVDHFLCQRFEGAVCFAVVLHEHDVPYLDHLRMVFVHQLAAGHFGALFGTAAVHMDLAARTARTRLAHLPEVVMLVAVQDMVCRQVFGPDRSRLGVTLETFFLGTLKYRGIQVRRVDFQDIYDIFPCKINRLLLEIVAERPVAQHLEHGMVIGVMTYFLQVIMFAAHAQTFLAVRYTRILDRVVAQNNTFPRIHTCVGEHQRRVVFDNHWCRRYYLVTFRRHKIQK